MRKRAEDSLVASSDLKVQSKSVGFGAMLGLLLVFVAVVGAVSFSVRNDIREQMLSVDSHVLSLLVQNEIALAEREAGLVFEFEALDEVEVWGALLETTTVSGVFAIQYYDADGELVQGSSNALVDRALPEEVVAFLGTGRPRSYFLPGVSLSRFVDPVFAGDREVSIVDVYLPLRGAEAEASLGTARYLMDGSVLAREFAVLDGRLLRQAGVAIGLGSLAMVGLFWLAWRRLSAANERVLRQAKRLQKVNTELAMLARTSAVGSVTAHLIHGLKNPLAGLRQVVSARRSGVEAIDEEEWKGASEAADRMQRMVEEVVAVLQDAGSGLNYETCSEDLLGELENRFGAEAERLAVSFSVSGDGGVQMDSSVSSIALLVATNLVQNAFEALDGGGRVSVLLRQEGENVVIRVEDDGRGISDEMKDRLFVPVSSGKSGGAGIGLSISSQLAKHLGGDLRFVDTPERGAVFELCFPAREVMEEEDR